MFGIHLTRSSNDCSNSICSNRSSGEAIEFCHTGAELKQLLAVLSLEVIGRKRLTIAADANDCKMELIWLDRSKSRPPSQHWKSSGIGLVSAKLGAAPLVLFLLSAALMETTRCVGRVPKEPV